MTAKKIRWSEVVRQSTGMHPMDSGGANGRHWQRPLPERSIKLSGRVADPSATSKWAQHGELSGSIALHAFLDEHFEIDQKLTRWLRRQDVHNYREYADALAERLGLVVLQSDYTYNWENDLSQDFQFSIVGPEGADYYHSDECYFVIETHNGADARGGFSDPVVCKPVDDSSWYDVVCGVSFTEGFDVEGNEIPHEALQSLDEKFQVGYSSNPSYRFGESVAQVIAIDADKNEFEVLLKSGERVKGYFHCRDSNGGFLT